MSSHFSYKKIDETGYNPGGQYGATQGAYPAGQGAYPAGQPGGYHAQTGAPPIGWNPAGNPGGAPPPAWNQGGAPQQAWNQGGAPPPTWNQGGAPPPAWNQGANPGVPPPSYDSVATEDLPLDDDNHGGPPPSMPSAPPPPTAESVAGYEGIGYTAGDFLAPPSAFVDSAPDAPPSERPHFAHGPTWSDEELRTALLEHISQFCCYGTGTARNMVINDKNRTGAYHYILETFGEARQVNWNFKPYSGGPIDGPECGRAPTPWEMPAQAQELFKDVTHKMEVPHTSYVRPCHGCRASGMVECHKCYGRGRMRCHWCHGRGHRGIGDNRRRCYTCHGYGQVQCRTCWGRGLVTCPSCQSQCNLRFFIELTIQWKNHVGESITQDTVVPNEEIKKAQGTEAYKEAHQKVWPVTGFFVPEINRASNELVTQHASMFRNERIWQQRQTIRIVPVVDVGYRWKDVTSKYFVYGLEKKVHLPDYPQTCCCGCTIL